MFVRKFEESVTEEMPEQNKDYGTAKTGADPAV
jgi:hypothetical protein